MADALTYLIGVAEKAGLARVARALGRVRIDLVMTAVNDRPRGRAGGRRGERPGSGRAGPKRH
jgi:hypothetical protein